MSDRNASNTGDNTNELGNAGYYSQGEPSAAAGGNRMPEALQDTANRTQSSKSTDEALAATFERTTGPETAQVENSDTHTGPGDQEGTYAGFADADTIPDNVEGWAGTDNISNTDDGEA
jgi:hypothetical protein